MQPKKYIKSLLLLIALGTVHLGNAMGGTPRKTPIKTPAVRKKAAKKTQEEAMPAQDISKSHELYVLQAFVQQSESRPSFVVKDILIKVDAGQPLNTTEEAAILEWYNKVYKSLIVKQHPSKTKKSIRIVPKKPSQQAIPSTPVGSHLRKTAGDSFSPLRKSSSHLSPEHQQGAVKFAQLDGYTLLQRAFGPTPPTSPDTSLNSSESIGCMESPERIHYELVVPYESPLPSANTPSKINSSDASEAQTPGSASEHTSTNSEIKRISNAIALLRLMHFDEAQEESEKSETGLTVSPSLLEKLNALQDDK